MADIVWTDLTGDGSFDDAANWLTGTVPGAGDDATILLPGTVTTSGGETIDTLALGVGVTLVAHNFTILGEPDLDDLTGTTAVAGTMIVADGSNVAVAGTVDNTGTVQLLGSYFGDTLLVGNGSVSTLTLTGGGTVALSDFGSNFISAGVNGAVLDNTNNLIEGAGVIGNGGMTVINAGTIAATGTADTLILQSSSVTNTGLIEAIGPAGLEIRETVVNAGGTIAGLAGHADIEGGADIVGGTLVGTAGGLVLFTSGTPLLDGATAGAITLLGTAELADGYGVIADGTLANDGTLVLDGSYFGDTFFVGNGTVATLTLTGGGTVALSDFGSNFINAGVGGAVLDNADNTIEGAGVIGDGGVAVVNAGTIDATGTATTLILQSSSVTNTGLLEATGPAGLEIRETVLNAGATILAAGGNVDVEGGADVVGGTIATRNGSTAVLSGTPLLDGATAGAITLLGTAVLADGQGAAATGTLVNDGTLALAGSYFGDTFYVGSGTVATLTLTGGGTVALSDFGSNFISAGVGGAVLDNADNTIEGAGVIGNGAVAVVNAGTIDATGTAYTLVLQSSSVTNTGLLEATGPAGLEIRETVVNAGATILAAGGDVDLEGGADIVGGTIATRGGSAAVLTGTPILDGATDGAITLLGTAVLADGQGAAAAGTLVNDGTLALAGSYFGDTFYVGSGTAATLTLTGGGTVALSDFGSNFINAGVPGAVLDNTNNTIEGAGVIGNGGVAIVNAGTIDATGTAYTLILQSSSVTNTGLLEATGPAGLEIRETVVNTGATILAAGGHVDLEGGAEIVGGTLAGASGFVLSGTPLLDGATAGAITLESTAAVADGNAAQASGTLVNDGTLVLDGTYFGTTLDVGAGTASTLTLTGGGTLALADFGGNDINGGVSGAVLDNTDNTIEGAGYLGDGNLSVINAGTIAATGTAASLVVRGPALTNTGLVEAVGPAGLSIQTATVANAGTLLATAVGGVTVNAPITGTGQLVLDPSATMVLLGSVGAGQTVDFLGASTLRLGTPTSFAGSLASVFAGVTIDLPDFTLTGATLAGGVLDLTGNFGEVDYTVLGSAGVTATFGADGTGGSEVLFTGGSPPVVCFCPGTRIATPWGQRAVEELRAGDLVLTDAGHARPVRWLGRQTVATRFADAFRVAPIRIRAGALAENLPLRDLLVSSDHALMVEGVFVQAGALVNGVSITREDAVLPERIFYFHVELADHSLILAEGVAAETFIDNVDRLAFDNWDEHVALGVDTAPLVEMPHARAKAHRQVPRALRVRLAARGVALHGQDVAVVA